METVKRYMNLPSPPAPPPLAGEGCAAAREREAVQPDLIGSIGNQPSTITASASTSALRGSEATPTAARDG